MPGGINEVQKILLAIVDVFHLNCMALDSNSPLPLEIHVVEHLILKFPFIYGIGSFKQAIGQGAFPMVDMCYDTEISDSVHPADYLKNRCKYIKI